MNPLPRPTFSGRANSRHASRTLVAGILAITAGATFFAQPAVAQIEDPRPLIGVLVPTSGDYAGLGERVMRAVQMAESAMPTGRFQVYDTSADPVAALALATADGAVAVIGPIGEEETLAVVASLHAQSLPVFTVGGLNEVERSHPRAFRMRTSVVDQAEALAHALVLAYGEQTMAVLRPDDAYGEEATLGFVRGVVDAGGRVLRSVEYEAGEPDVEDAVFALMGRRTQRLDVPSNPWRSPPRIDIDHDRGDRTRPDVVFVPDYADQIANILPFLAFHGWIEYDLDDTVQLAGLSGWDGYALSFAGDVAAGALVTLTFHVDDASPAVEVFRSNYELLFGERPLDFDAQVFDGAMFLLEAAHRLPRDDHTPEGFLYAFDSIDDLEGACGEMWFDLEGGVVRDIGLWQVDNAGFLLPMGTIHPDRW